MQSLFDVVLRIKKCMCVHVLDAHIHNMRCHRFPYIHTMRTTKRLLAHSTSTLTRFDNITNVFIPPLLSLCILLCVCVCRLSSQIQPFFSSCNCHTNAEAKIFLSGCILQSVYVCYIHWSTHTHGEFQCLLIMLLPALSGKLFFSLSFSFSFYSCLYLFRFGL